MNNNHPLNKKIPSFECLIIILVFVITLSSLIIFFSHFSFNLNTKIQNWIDTVTYFNNLLSPLFMIISTILIFVTYRENKNEIERQKKINEQTNNENNERALFSFNFPIIKEMIDNIHKNDLKINILDIRNYMNYESHQEKRKILITYKNKVSLKKEILSWLNSRENKHVRKTYNNNENIELPLSKEYDDFSHLEKEDDLNISDMNFNTLFKLDEKIDSYLDSSYFTFKEYCNYKYLKFENTFSNSYLHYDHSICEYFNEIDSILSLSKMLSSKYNEKKILSSYIYKNLGRYEIYTYLDYTYEYAYVSENEEFRDYFKERFDEMATILLMNESEVLYGHRLHTNKGEILKILSLINDTINIKSD